MISLLTTRVKAGTLACLVLCGLLEPSLAATTDDSQAQQLRQRVLDRLTGYDSIECTYSYFYDLSSGKPIPVKVQFKAKGKWVWFAEEAQLTAGDTSISKLRSETNVEGKIDCFFIGRKNERIFHAKGERFNFYACNELSPLSFIGRNSAFSFWSFKDTLRDILGSPGACISEPDGDYTKLYVYPEPPGGDYEGTSAIIMGAILYLDKDETMRRVDYVYRPVCPLEEVALYATKNAPKDVYRRSASIWFDEFVAINGRPFPTKLKEVVWKIDEDAIQDRDEVMRAQELLARKQITACESSVRLVEATNFWKEDTVYRMDVDPQSIKINNPSLTREDFVINPKDPDVYWNRETDDVKDEAGWGNLKKIRADRAARIRASGKQRRGNLLFLGSAAGLLVSVSSVISIVVLTTRLRRRQKTPGREPRHE